MTSTTTRFSREQPPIAPPHLVPVPAPEPAIMIARPTKPADAARSKRRMMLWGGGALVAAQLVLPTDFKPATLAGQAAASFYIQIMLASNDKEIELAKVRAIAEQQAALEAHRADIAGKCAIAGLLGPDVRRLCNGVAGSYFDTAGESAERSLRK